MSVTSLERERKDGGTGERGNKRKEERERFRGKDGKLKILMRKDTTNNRRER